MCKILVVDDEPQIRKGIATIIERGQGDRVTVLQAENGSEGKELILSEHPCIVITDIKMPIMDGLELIERINEQLVSPPQFIVLSGFDDFIYAKKAMKFGVREYLLKPVRRDELNSIIDKFMNRQKEKEAIYQSKHLQYIQNREGIMAIQEKYFNTLITTSRQDKKIRVLEELRKLGIGIKDGRVNLLVIDYKSQTGKTRPELLKLDRFSVQNIVEEVIRTQSHNAINYYDFDKHMIVVLWSDDGENDEEIMRRFNEEISRCLKKFLQLDIYTAAVCGIDNLMDLNQAYDLALSNLDCKISSISENIIFDREVDGKRNFYEVIKGYQIDIQSSLEFSQYYKVNLAVRELFDLLKRNEVSVDNYKYAYEQLTVEIIHYFDHKCLDIFKAMDQEAFVKPFDAFWDLESLENALSKTLFDIGQLVLKKRESMTNVKLIDQIIDYLNDHYSENINLNSVAAEFEKTSSYISTLFKREINKNFLGYLTDLRMEKAKIILDDVTIKIGDVGSLVGYVNPKHFNVVFKKNVGMTPKAYRNKKLR